jgi:hypothetical protein
MSSALSVVFVAARPIASMVLETFIIRERGRFSSYGEQ